MIISALFKSFTFDKYLLTFTFFSKGEYKVIFSVFHDISQFLKKSTHSCNTLKILTRNRSLYCRLDPQEQNHAEDCIEIV